MARPLSVRKVLEVKIIVSSTLAKISNILDIQSGCDSDDQELATRSLRVSKVRENMCPRYYLPLWQISLKLLLDMDSA